MTGLSTYDIEFLIQTGVLNPVIPANKKRKLIHQQVVEYMNNLYERATKKPFNSGG